ncbi:MAG TPA: pilus assembly protein TadG-related protein [Candidatus Acidoferrales bacterium]|nr:pilus assembly protein TadG-related protein [Candidatus Acidoferrales bacterium]
MRRNRQAGQALYITAASLVVLMGFAGLAIDMGALRYQKRLQQTAADGAAIAGATELPYDSSGVGGVAQKAAADNGFSGSLNTGCPPPAMTGDVGSVAVTVNNPPCSGPHSGDSKYVEAYVSAVQPTYFMKVFGHSSEVVAARAVATMIDNSGGYNGCVYTLGPPGTGIGVTNSGTPTVTAPTCGFEDGGDWTTNGKTVNITAGSIGVVGGDTNHGGGSVTCTQTGMSCPQTGIAPVTDPLALSPPCTGSACTGTSSINATNGNCGSGCSFSPGYYSGISIQGGTVDFQPGTYVVDGNFTVNGNSTLCNSTNANCSGMNTNPPTSMNDGVTFYITGGGSVSINGTSNVYLSAPNSGTYAGILFYQDPADTSAATLNGTNTSYYQGALYFPTAQLNFGGNLTNTTAAYTVIVADDLKFFGTSNVTINSNYSSLPGGVFPIKNAVLVE